MSRVGGAAVLALLGASVAAGAGVSSQGRLEAERRNLMPLPQAIAWRGEPLTITRQFAISIEGPDGGVEPRLRRAALRMTERLARQTGIPLVARIEPDPTRARFNIEYESAVAEVQQAVEDEAYTLDVDAHGAVLRAPTPYGVLRGIETFLQLVEVAPPAGSREGSRAEPIADLEPEPVDFIVPGVSIRDAPRFPWRGLLIDPGRHFLSPDVIKRNLDAMAAVKLNVLHWHLSEDQGFRVESIVFPELHERGSDGRYYSQNDVREIIEYARDRGIRVMPEFDMPGHATSWLVGYPELASAPGPYEIIDQWGVQDPALDPTREQTFEFIAALIGELAGLFPDPYFHIGGDEVNGNHWDANADIQRFIVEYGLVDNHGLQAYFNGRIQPLLAGLGKKMVGWDEILHPDLTADVVIHSWRGQESLAAAARAGYPGILSNGYYIDLIQPAASHYAVDPLGGPAADLDADDRQLILGGEATMWGEYVVDETIDSRIWPRTVAIAERFWSAASVSEVDDMYRRLEATSAWLEWTGVTHRSGYLTMLERLAGNASVDSLRVLADVVEPVEGYRRGRTREYTRFTPLNRLVDAARPESVIARRFAGMVSRYLEPESASGLDAQERKDLEAQLRAQLTVWRDNHQALVSLARDSVMLPEAETLSAQLRVAAQTGLAALDDLESSRRTPGQEVTARNEALAAAGPPHGAVELVVVVPVLSLVAAAAEVQR